MSTAGSWFVILGMFAFISLIVGWWCSRRSTTAGWVLAAFGLTGLLISAWLSRHPAAWANVLPASSVQYVEGAMATPFMMLILGIAWTQSRRPRQRGVVGVGTMVAVVLFLQGSLWMVQQTPAQQLSDQYAPSHLVMQSQDYACVPAAAATALNMMGYESTELQMAQLTSTRPGRGATAIRALAGLQQRLAGSNVKVRLAAPQVEQLRLIEPPMLLTVNFDHSRTNNHMIVVLSSDAMGAEVLDPTDGEMYMPWSLLDEAMAGPAIVFERKDFRQARSNASGDGALKADR